MTPSNLEKIKEKIPELLYGAVFYTNGLIIERLLDPSFNITKIGSILSEIIKNIKNFLAEIKEETTEYKRITFLVGNKKIAVLRIGEDTHAIFVFENLWEPMQIIVKKIKEDLIHISEIIDIPLSEIEKNKLMEQIENLKREKKQLEKKEKELKENLETLEERCEFRQSLKQDLEEDVDVLASKRDKITDRLKSVNEIYDDYESREKLTDRQEILFKLTGAEKQRLEHRLDSLNQRIAEEKQKKEKLLMKIEREEKEDAKKRELLIENTEKIKEKKEEILEKEIDLAEKAQEIGKKELKPENLLDTETKE
ncbi:MAG: hypothetical protein ACTSRW_12805 [Candidatus Helarchaeota archaeon]